MSITDLCPCGKPAEHLNAPEESADWACRVPKASADTRELFHRVRAEGYDDGYGDGREVGARDAMDFLLMFIEEVRAALESGDLRDLRPEYIAPWLQARAAAVIVKGTSR